MALLASWTNNETGGRRRRAPLPALAAAAALTLAALAGTPAAGAEPGNPKADKTAPTVTTPAPPRAAGALRMIFPRSLIANGLAARLAAGFRKGHKVEVTILPRKTGLGFEALLAGTAELAVTDDIAAERRFVAAKHGITRHNVMYTEMLIVGPKADPADINGMISVIEAFKALAASSSTFLGRGDGSGVALSERRYWREAGLKPDAETDRWYSTTRSDMRTTLLRAAKANAYTLTDRGTWLSLPSTVELGELVADDPRLQLRYGVVVVNPKGRKGLNVTAAAAFATWLTGKEAQALIESFKIGDETPYIPESGLQR
ncbi:MAG: substrate-binding domain-containing protein [Bauldia litoralis]